MNKKILFLMLVFSLFLISCEETLVDEAQDEISRGLEEPAEEVEIEEEVQDTGTLEEETEEKISCEANDDCDKGLLCIDGGCATIEELYNTECENKCTISSVTMLTSDDETYNLKLGQGSYSYAGALEWKLMKTPGYCQGENPLVAVNVIKKTTGKIVGEQVLTLHKGETSDAITHPTIKSVKFTATLADVTESCS